MGRYYSGIIEGKFWFGLQSSRVGERFGAYEHDSNLILYQINDKQIAIDEMKNIKEVLGKSLELFDKFFKEHVGYNDEMLKEYFEKNNTKLTRELLSDYADYCFGRDVIRHFERTGATTCWFEAEC